VRFFINRERLEPEETEGLLHSKDAQRFAVCASFAFSI